MIIEEIYAGVAISTIYLKVQREEMQHGYRQNNTRFKSQICCISA